MSALPRLASAPASAARPSKARQLRNMLESPELGFLMEAHNGLSARVVEEAGFAGIWASGLSISAALGVRDNNEASWTQVLEVLEFMSDATAIPILVDGDTGYGNFNNVRRLVAKLCQRGIAGVCIEDKLFPKTNSFIGDNQPLADIDEFCGRIKAGKDSQTDPDFRLVARVEALISGWGMDEALRRAEAYHRAGADAILIHSKKSSADEILGFCKAWGNRAPVVIVPTMYYATPTDVFRKAGISTIIWANHNMRAALGAMREVSRRIFAEQSLTGIEGAVPSVKDVFDITGNKELSDAEARYLPRHDPARAILLAASRGTQLGALTEDRPKCMLDVRGKPLLARLVATLKESGVADVTVVRGYRKEAIKLPGVAVVDNDAYETTGEVASLACALDRLKGPCIVAYGDILFRRYILDNLLETAGDIVLVVDTRTVGHHQVREGDMLRTSRPYTGDPLEEEPATVKAFLERIDPRADGEWIGLARLSKAGAERVRREIEAMRADGSAATAGVPDLFKRLIAAGETLTVCWINGHWLDVNDAFDLARARNFL